MPNVECILCSQQFYAKPSHIIRGWGKYCSKTCQYKGQKTGSLTRCSACSKEVYKTKTEQTRSKSQKYFCSKACQTRWRNTEYSGDKHSNWVSGKASYRTTLMRSGRIQQCAKCNLSDRRVLAVHHKDRNRDNNSLSNLVWLCHNCHYLVHHDKQESEGFLVAVA